MELVSLQQWETAAGEYERLPYVRRVGGVRLPERWEPLLAGTGAVLLESARGGRYTYFIPRPKPLAWPELSRPAGTGPGVLAALRAFLKKHRAPRWPGLPPFTGGLVGALSYDLAREIENLPARAEDDLGLPPAVLSVADEVLVFDRETGTAYAVVVAESPVVDSASGHLRERFEVARERCAALVKDFQTACEERASERAAALPSAVSETAGGDSSGPPVAAPAPAMRTLSLDRAAYTAAVRRVQAYIGAGDTYQVNLSLRETRPLTAHPAAVYDALRRINPSPYMAYVPAGEWTLVCGSPELLVKSVNGCVEARPIAGTRPRGACGDSDAALRGELLAHPKERAEHLMLVDLIRNDLGRVCRYGSVRVRDYMVAEGYSHVQHIVSHVVGELAPERDEVDVVASAFPGGTITGAPKVRTMQIIEELEPVRRGFYTGSVGWFGYNGDFELNIVIRTLLAGRGQAHVQAGAGVVADSVPEREFEESLNKARALWAALEEATC
ncbi:anthranilate synthase component I family protein [Ruficoccus amylovorans]|uniref:Anthranilate synthase component I family protein n=1 Tax=Ruficoccus amylovorans TaxID=1804625 RepID=A0A842HHR9_9BACT|nr:anthranilate synthase component I family protein [Ruficoccus amylovorans]MBC2596073.1 anthranilate synthase component I family protein [Ruficoccus amylovorans]